MQVIFGFHSVLEMVQRGIQEEEGSASYKKSKKRDYKTLFIIHQFVDEVNFERISLAKSAKEAWEVLNKARGGVVLNKAHSGVEEEMCELENNIETEGKQNEKQESNQEIDFEEQEQPQQHLPTYDLLLFKKYIKCINQIKIKSKPKML